MLLEIDGTIDKTGTPFNKLAETIEADPGQCDLLIRNATFFKKINRDCKQISLVQDYYGKDEQQLDVCKHSDYVVFNSDFTRDKFDRSESLRTIPIGVDETLFKPMANFRSGNDIFSGFKRTGIFVGDYNTTKNTRLFEEIARENSHVDFIYISKAGYKINLPNIRNYPGGVNERGMVKLYNEADFCIMCSPLETLHLTTVEAALCDTPIIGTNTGWLANYYNEAVGVMVDKPHSVEKFSDAIREVSENSYSPREYMLTTPFTWTSCKESWRQLIVETLNE